MHKILAITPLLLLAGCFEPPPKSISLDFDGEWKGRRINENNNPICSPTSIYGDIKEGEVSFTLAYNNTLLRGTVNEWGHIELKDNNPMWVYHFNGKARITVLRGVGR
ncbi:hypothetical protein [Vibrio sonorensis]|uniref:hypothetical protein n=1 Tax=Vibrio sonorensis TaxID=1004316 RepID=UPI0008D9D82C|nr:hypothetical protein [Vibrio sonorensis]